MINLCAGIVANYILGTFSLQENWMVKCSLNSLVKFTTALWRFSKTTIKLENDVFFQQYGALPQYAAPDFLNKVLPNTVL